MSFYREGENCFAPLPAPISVERRQEAARLILAVEEEMG